MSDELTLVEADSEQSRSRCHKSRDAMMDTVSYFAIGFVFVGLIFSAAGFLYPRGVKHDPQASAAENERAEIEYMQLTKALNAIIVAGMILTGLGGLILSAIFTATVLCQDCHHHDDDHQHKHHHHHHHQHDRGDRTDMTSRGPASQTTSSPAGGTNGTVNYGAVPESGSGSVAGQ
ncbi:hypothetical protein ACOMHN_010427 [Nucella lapillus]